MSHLQGVAPASNEDGDRKSAKKIRSSLLMSERTTLPRFKDSEFAFKSKSKKMDMVKKRELKSTVFQISTAPLNMFPTRQFPMPHHQRDTLAKTMSVEEVMETTLYPEDHDSKGHKRWKEIRHLFLVTRKPEHSHGSIENALWHFGHHGISCNHFVHAIMDEFRFHPKKDDMEAHLRWLYWSFPGGTSDNADWRDILATLRICVFFRMVQDRPQDLLLAIFDIYCYGGTDGRKSEGHPNDVWYIVNACETLKKIFITACETPFEHDTMNELVDKAILADCGVTAAGQDADGPYGLQGKLQKYNESMKRRQFRQFMRTHSDPLVKKFQEYCWRRLPVDLRLQSLDDQQVTALQATDRILYRFKLQQALHIYKKNLLKSMWVDWVLAARRLSVVRRHNNRKYKYKKVVLFQFWRKLASTERVKRNKRILADVMGNYAMKARVFHRIKLFVYQESYIIRVAGRFNKHAKTEKLAFSHMREFIRLAWQRQLYHKWWNYCVQEHNWELAMDHDWERLLTRPLQEWRKWASWEAQTKRMERLVIENKMKFDRQMAESTVAAEELRKVEEAKKKEKEEAQAAAAEVEKQERLAKARETAKLEKKKDRDILLGSQRDARRRRVRKQMALFKKKFAERWITKRADFVDKAEGRVKAYVTDPQNERAIEMRFEKLKREFFMPPAKENMDRENILNNAKNLVFLFLDAKLRKDNLKMEAVLFKFDKDKKGYLTYDEFKELVKALGVKLNPSQMAQVIKAVDADGDGCLELDELLESMQDIDKMGIPGSPWKMYIDGAQDVIVYHNFLTDRKVYEYQMTDEILEEVNISNYYGEAEEQAKREADEEKIKDWDRVMNNLMANRIVYMYRFWKSRKKRKAYAWKLQSRESAARRDWAVLIARFCAQRYYGYKVREVFKKELALTYEKVYKADTGDIFWFNHLLGTSHWERPHLLWRYGDVAMPAEWIPIDVPTVTDEELKADPAREQMYALHYWHVKAQRDLPRKPDGLPPCCLCNRHLAKFSCFECHEANYCHKCYRDTHGSPMFFAQKSFLTMEQRQKAEILEQLKFSKTHHWGAVKYPRCKMCKTEKVLAGYHCATCAVDMCRPCSRRIHERLKDHELYTI
jgi:hypothetical protein